MTQEELFEQELRKVNVDELKQYIRDRGWHQIEYQNPRLHVYCNEDQVLLAFPAHEGFSDYWRRIAEVFERLALLEQVWMPYLIQRFLS